MSKYYSKNFLISQSVIDKMNGCKCSSTTLSHPVSNQGMLEGGVCKSVVGVGGVEDSSLEFNTRYFNDDDVTIRGDEEGGGDSTNNTLHTSTSVVGEIPPLKDVANKNINSPSLRKESPVQNMTIDKTPFYNTTSVNDITTTYKASPPSVKDTTMEYEIQHPTSAGKKRESNKKVMNKELQAKLKQQSILERIKKRVNQDKDNDFLKIKPSKIDKVKYIKKKDISIKGIAPIAPVPSKKVKPLTPPTPMSKTGLEGAASNKLSHSSSRSMTYDGNDRDTSFEPSSGLSSSFEPSSTLSTSSNEYSNSTLRDRSPLRKFRGEHSPGRVASSLSKSIFKPSPIVKEHNSRKVRELEIVRRSNIKKPFAKISKERGGFGKLSRVVKTKGFKRARIQDTTTSSNMKGPTKKISRKHVRGRRDSSKLTIESDDEVLKGPRGVKRSDVFKKPVTKVMKKMNPFKTWRL